MKGLGRATITSNPILIERFKQKFLRQQAQHPVTANEMNEISLTKKYADGRQKLLGTHLGAPTRLPPQKGIKGWQPKRRLMDVLLNRGQQKRTKTWPTTK